MLALFYFWFAEFVQRAQTKDCLSAIMEQTCVIHTCYVTPTYLCTYSPYLPTYMTVCSSASTHRTEKIAIICCTLWHKSTELCRMCICNCAKRFGDKGPFVRWLVSMFAAIFPRQGDQILSEKFAQKFAQKPYFSEFIACFFPVKIVHKKFGLLMQFPKYAFC
jgi:hypothetical protein